MFTCTWAPTVFQGPQLVDRHLGRLPVGERLHAVLGDHARRIEDLGITHLLVAQRWWGSGEETEGSSLDCLAMTSYFAGCTSAIKLITAIHPGFFHPTVIAKWAASLNALYPDRWAINVTSGWNLQEFAMYGIDALTHDERYARSAEFIRVLRQAWSGQVFDFEGLHYQIKGMQLEPRPTSKLTIYQGGQSPAALQMAGEHADWMFLNGGRPEKLSQLISHARTEAASHGRQLRFAVYAAPLCADTDALAWAEIDTRLARLDQGLVQRRQAKVGGAVGMWAGGDDPLTHLDTNEGFCTRLIGSPVTILERIEELRSIGVDMLHLELRDALFIEHVLPRIHAM